MAEVPAVRKPRSRLMRGLYFGLGILCVGLAYMSWLPGIPTFDFVILAAFFFARSSDRFHTWLVTHPVFGRIIRGYRSDGFTVRTKLVAAAAVVISLGFSIIVLVDNLVVRLILGVVGVYAIWFIMSRPTRINPDPTSP
ncbi:MAG TPA: YbaN family protein [Acidimicrobiia bacterium]|nr:YbaN family protein [Acidimicrobiia bacterium]